MTKRIPESVISEVLQRTDIVDLIESRIPLKKAGKDYMACCPFHEEKTPSFTVSREKQFYHCFGCGAHDRAIGFLMNYDNLSFNQAVEELASQAGIGVSYEQSKQISPRARKEVEHHILVLRIAKARRERRERLTAQEMKDEMQAWRALG